MKKCLVIIVLIIGVLQAQNPAHIHHLYGLKETTQGVFTLDALDQTNGNSVAVETYTMDFQLGSNYAYQPSSNKVLYVDSNTQATLTLIGNYELPSLYESGYSGLNNVLTIQGMINTLAFNPTVDSVFYTYSLDTKRISILDKDNGALEAESNGLNDDFDQESLSSCFFDNQYFLSGNILGNTFTTIYKFDNVLNTPDTINVVLDFLYLTADSQAGLFGITPNTSLGFDLVKFDPNFNSFQFVGTLPSCSACATETFSYDKNAMVIDPENNHLIVSRSETILGNTKLYLSTFDLSDASMVYNIETPERYSNLSFHKPLPDLVYPGDANHDKTVNMLDILPIGIKYNDTLVERLEISTEWIGQNAFDTGDSLANNVDKKHADCNGDGQINSIDMDDAIFTNYSYLHYSEKGTNANCDFPLYINVPNTLKEGESVEIEIGLDLSSNALKDVYGVTFTIEYDTNFIVQNTLNTQGVNAWFGTENLNFIQRNLDDYPSARMDVGVVGIDKFNRNGGGVLLNGIWTMEDEVIPIAQSFQDMAFRITNVFVIDYDENVIDACGIDTVIRVYDKTIGIQEKENLILDLFPNPSNEPYLNISNIANLETVEIYDLQGKLLKSSTDNFSFIDMSHFSKGVYVVKANAGKKTYVNKLILSKL